MAAVRIKRPISCCAWLVLLAACCAAMGAIARGADPQPSPVGQKVVDVRINGQRDVPMSKIIPLIRTRAGRTFDLDVIENDVRSLNKSRLFQDVRPKYQQVPEGVVVIFQVVERRTIHYIHYYGREKIRREKVLADKSGLKVGDALDPFSVEEGRRKLEEFYHEKGHGKVVVTVLEGDKPQDRGVVFLIHEGPKQKISHVNFVGNTIDRGARLKTQIKSTPPKFFLFGGHADRTLIDEDVQTLTAYYRRLGYFQAVIGREMKYNDNQDRVDLTFVINEGPRYVVRSIRFMGNTKFDEAQLSSDLKMKPGEFFDQTKMDTDVVTIQDVYGGRGYIFANVEAQPTFLEDAGQLDLVYHLEEGSRFRVGKINVVINGENPHTRTTAVLNRLSFHTGDIADIREIRASERRLKASSIFQTNPALGNPPRIVFTLPESDGALADKEPRRSGVRGQSPDPDRHVARRPATPETSDHEPFVDLDMVFVAPAEDTQTSAKGIDSDTTESSISPRAAINDAANWIVGASLVPPQTTVPPSAHRIDASARSPWRRMLSFAKRPVSTSDKAGMQGSIAGPPASEMGRMPPSSTASIPQQDLIVRGQDPGGFGGVMMPGPAQPTQRQLARRQGPQPVTAYQQPYQPVPNQQPAPQQPAYQPPAYQQPTYQQPYQQPAYQQPTYPTQTYPQPPAAGYTVPYATQPGGQPATSPPAQGYLPPIGPTGPTTPSVPGQPGAPGTLPPPNGYNGPSDLFPEGGYVDLEGEPTLDAPFTVHVDETQTGRIMVGVGVNSNAGLVGSVIIDEQNFDITRFPRSWSEIGSGRVFRGNGQQLRIEAVPGTQFQRYSINFRDPYIFNSLVSFGVSGYFFNRQYLNWFEERLGGQMTWGYQIRPDLAGTVGLRAENVNVSRPSVPTPDQLQEVLGDNGLYTARFSLVQDTRDSAFLPTEGHRIELGYEQAFGDFDFPRGTFDGSQHFLIRQRPDGSGRHVLTLLTNVGISGTDTPIFENYFAGGFSTLRGFRFRGASPTELGVQVGGRFQWVNTAEYLFPITADDMLRAVVFCDFGTVEQSVKLDADTFRVAPGVGLRISIPAMGPAPIALDLAVPVAHAPGDQIQNFSFFVGITH